MNAYDFVNTWIWVIACFFLGAIWGSFINAAVHRLPRQISMVTRSRSFCPSCTHQLAWYDNVPILSYSLLWGRCRYCAKPIGPRYLWVELLTASLFAIAGYQFFAANHALEWWLISGYWRMRPELFFMQLFLIVDLVLLSVVDLEAWLIPIETTLYPWVPLGFILGAAFPEIHPSATQWYVNMPRVNALIDSFEGMVLGAGILWTVGFMTTLISFFWFRYCGRKDRPLEGMGGGDCHLLAMVGAMLGWKPALATIFIGIMIGCFSGISKIAWDRYQQQRLGDMWKPWQPTYELTPEQTATEPAKPSFWILAILGIVVLVGVGMLWDRSTLTFGGFMAPTQEEITHLHAKHPIFTVPQAWDARLVPVYLMAAIGVLMLAAFGFYTYLAQIDMLPQGNIEEQADGEKKEVLQGNYVPFGPSLAAAALFVVFYDPLIRNLAFWFSIGAQGQPPLSPHVMVGEDILKGIFVAAVHTLNACSEWILKCISWVLKLLGIGTHETVI